MEYGLIGEHLGHSFSKEIHERLSDRPYELREIAREDLGRFLRESDFRGINVTIPYKEAVLPYLDEVSPEARKIGAVNTIVRREGRLMGSNTDYYGFEALAGKAGIGFQGRSVLILGAGGAAKTVHAVAADHGASRIDHAVRTPRRTGQVSLDGLGAAPDYEIVVNCTPVGMFPHEEGSAVDLKRFPRLAGALDLVYNPLRTDFILDAEERGVPAEGGLYMLVAQAVQARSCFDAPGRGSSTGPDPTGTVFDSLLRAKRNIVLTGMPSSGKSTLGRLLASRLGREFLDTDEIIVRKASKPIPQIFAEDGEAAFRSLEAEVIRELSSRTGLVIATGGGAILNWENVRRLRRNGTICLIRRKLELLSPSADRPLSRDPDALRILAEKRREAYERAAERIIDNNGTPEEALSQFDC